MVKFVVKQYGSPASQQRVGMRPQRLRENALTRGCMRATALALAAAAKAINRAWGVVDAGGGG